MIKFKLKRELADRDITQKALSEKIGVRQPTISAICTNTIKELPVSILDKICKELNCKPADLIEYIPDEE